MIKSLNCAGKILDLSTPKVMGILNVTPDSFSDGGLFVSVTDAVDQARQMSDEGAAIIDIGGESTRPGATAVSSTEEMERILPVIDAINNEMDIIISVDTSKPDVMKKAVEAGAGLINDVRALQEKDAIKTVKETGVPVCIMHMLGEPRTMQDNPQYDDVVNDVKEFLQNRISVCVDQGIPDDNILIDPGFGFGKTVTHNLSLVKRLSEFSSLDKPIVMGVSRKSTIGEITGRPVDQRVYGSAALAALCCQSGANIIRAHDVAATVDAISLSTAVLNAN